MIAWLQEHAFIAACVGAIAMCFAAVYFAIGRNALRAVRHPDQHEHVTGEWL